MGVKTDITDAHGGAILDIGDKATAFCFDHRIIVQMHTIGTHLKDKYPNKAFNIYDADSFPTILAHIQKYLVELGEA